MPEPKNLQRSRQRLELRLPVRVRCRESADFEWTEVTRLLDVTPFGARFTLKRPVEKGRLLHMTIPMPRQLRVFDHVEDQYRVWALIRNVNTASAVDDKILSFEVGVAFIGKQPPRSYHDDPARRYAIGDPAPDKLVVAEDWIPTEMASSDKRTRTRHNIPVGMTLETFNDKGEVEFSEQTVAENIGSKGAAVYTSLSLHVGRFIRLSSEQYNVTVYAAVRGLSIGPSGVQRIHVEFLDRDWPL